MNTSKKLGGKAQAFNTQGETMKSIEVAYTVLIDDEAGYNGPTHVEVTYGPRGNDGRWAIEVSAIVTRQGFMRTVSYHEAIRVVSAIWPAKDGYSLMFQLRDECRDVHGDDDEGSDEWAKIVRGGYERTDEAIALEGTGRYTIESDVRINPDYENY